MTGPRYAPTIEPSAILDRSLREPASLIERWHGAAEGRLGYAGTPRVGGSCTAGLLRGAGGVGRAAGAAARLRGRAALRGLVHGGPAPGVGVARPVGRGVVAEPRVGGSGGDR